MNTLGVRVRFLPSDIVVDVPPETLVHQAALQAGVFLDAPCGGKGTCGKCRVILTDSRGSRSVLACRTIVREDATVEIPPQGAPARTAAAVADVRTAPPDSRLGVALDIGTTTIAAVLADLRSGKPLTSLTASNPQYAWGADVVSRITFASQSPEHVRRLHGVLIAAVDRLITAAGQAAGADPHRIDRVTVAGNTTMQLLFLGIDPTPLATAPFQPPIAGAYPVSTAERIGMRTLRPDTPVLLLPNISGWIGGDTTGVIIATGIADAPRPLLAVDIGTNGEMVLGSRHGLWATSTAAGPCFEGARITYGMRATEGAISGISWIDGDLQCETIGEDAEPRGICGSGLIDAIAVLRSVGAIDPSGRIPFGEDGVSLPDAVVRRFRPDAADGGGILLAFSTRGEILLTQRDIREFQLAKAAIRAGISVLLTESDVGGACNLDTLLLAGMFGNSINARNAVAVGLIPDMPLEKIRFIGNAACEGALTVLLQSAAEGMGHPTIGNVHTVELSARADFQAAFADAMRLEAL